jgi:hypothetical protein
VQCSTQYSGARYTEPDLGEALVALDEPLVAEGHVVGTVADGLLGVLNRGSHLGLGLGLGLDWDRTGQYDSTTVLSTVQCSAV